MSKTNTTKKQVFVSADMAARYTKSQLRDMVEAPLEVGLRVVKNPLAAG